MDPVDLPPDGKVVHISQIIEPSNVFSMDWLKYQVRTVNFANVALLITLLLVSSSVKETLSRQEAQNAVSTQTLIQSQDIFAKSQAQIVALHEELVSINQTRAAISSTLTATNRYIEDFRSFLVQSGLDNSTAFIQTQLDTIITLQDRVDNSTDAIATLQGNVATLQIQGSLLTSVFSMNGVGPWNLPLTCNLTPRSLNSFIKVSVGLGYNCAIPSVATVLYMQIFRDGTVPVLSGHQFHILVDYAYGSLTNWFAVDSSAHTTQPMSYTFVLSSNSPVSCALDVGRVLVEEIRV